MSKQAHSPGPWEVRRDTTGQYLGVFSRVKIGESVIWPVRVKDEADARLIAAAPEVIESLERILSLLDYEFADQLSALSITDQDAIALARLRLAKATGGAE